MNRNSDRVGQPVPAELASSVDEKFSFDFISPTEFVTLPSEGRYYPKNHPAHGLKEIELKYPTTKHQEVLNNQSLMRKGKSVDKMLQMLVKDESIRVSSLLSCDRAALTTTARIMMHDEYYTTKVVCPVCTQPTRIDVDLTKIEPNYARKSGWESTVNLLEREGDYDVFRATLPVTKYHVEFRLMTGEDEDQIMQSINKRKQYNLEETPIVDQMTRLITAVESPDGKRYTSPYIVGEFVTKIPAKDTNAFFAAYSKVSPEFKIEQEFSCPSCNNFESKFTVKTDAGFFWPKR